MVGPPMMSTLGVYFKKHRGLANSIFTASASVGGLILAPVFTTLFEEYGYTGTMLIVAGLLLNSLVSAAFMRPPSWFTTKKNTHRTEKEAVYDKLIQNDAEHVSENQLYEASDYTSAKYNGHGVTSNKDTNDNDRCIANNLQTTKSGHSENSTDTENHTHSFSEKQHSVSRKIKSDGAHESMQKIKCKEKGMYVSGENLHGSLISVNMDIDENETSVTKSTQSFCSSTQAMVADFIKLFDFNLLKDVSVLLYLAMAFVTCSGMVLIPVYLAPFAKDAGLTYDDIAIMLSLAASVDVVSKIVSGIIADRQWIRRSSMLAFAAFATGTVCHIARLCTSKSLILAMAVLAGSNAFVYVDIIPYFCHN